MLPAIWYALLSPTWAIIAMLLTTVSNWFQSEKKIRFLTFPSSPCWLVYNVLNGSFAGVITEIFVMSSLIIAIIRFDIKKSKKNEEEVTNVNS